MTAVLRELVAKLGFQVDDTGFKRAAAGVERLKTSVQGVDTSLARARGRFRDAAGRMREADGKFVGSGGGKGLTNATQGVQGLSLAVGGLQSSLQRLGASLGLGALLGKMTSLASDANETDNVLEQVFGKAGAAQVKDWAATTGREIGRSRYTLREYAGQLGAMLEPMTGSSTKAQEMSTTLAKLSVDLASFFNTADDDALLALKSGLTGETEPLRRYGIVLLDATLQEYAHAQGIRKKLSAMSNAEKVELRYRYILAHTTKAQGDAARTADGFANSSRALRDNLKDLGTWIGQKLLPIVGRMIKWASDGIDRFRELGRTSNIVEGALIAVATALTALGAAAAKDMLPAIIGLTLLSVAADEVITTLEGGQSILRDWIDALGGEGTTDRWVKALKENLEDLDQHMPDFVTSWNLLTDSIDDVGFAIQELLTEMKRLALTPITAPMQWIDKLNDTLNNLPGLKQVHERIQANKAKWRAEHPGEVLPGDEAKWWSAENTDRPLEAVTRGSMAEAATTLPQQIEMRRARKQRQYVQDQQARQERARLRRQKRGEALSSRVREPTVIPDAGMSVAPAEPLVSEQVMSLPAASSSSSVTNVTNINVTNGPVNMSGGDQDAERRATRAIKAERRATLDAIKKGG